ncbi:hypothetical protein AB0G85_26040 [Streptomyces sioyaensis]|uniref:hypothetical protein n=1 Tax=Streptomyces sioyaensis TaxID=67364 RepID=UPI0033D68CCC
MPGDEEGSEEVIQLTINETALRDLVAAGATFPEVIEYLSHRRPRELSPIEFLSIFQQELGISFVESRAMLEYFAPQMKPIADSGLIDERGRTLLRRCSSADGYRTQQTSGTEHSPLPSRANLSS